MMNKLRNWMDSPLTWGRYWKFSGIWSLICLAIGGWFLVANYTDYGTWVKAQISKVFKRKK